MPTSYNDTVEWMFSQLPMYQRQGKSAFKKDLTNILQFAKHLDHPENKFKTIHVAGTNGKGSVCHMIASILQEAGYKTGLYTSPHLKDFRERIRLNGKMIDENSVIDFIAQNRPFLEEHQLSFFEMSVGMAFHFFAQEKVDIAIIETGLGGRLDSTNIIHPEIAVITNIGMDHMNMLGHTLAQIAKEKAGIIKKNTPVVIGEHHEQTDAVFVETAQKLSAPLYFAQDRSFRNYKISLQGNYQAQNRTTVLQVIELLTQESWKIDSDHIANGLLKVVENTGLQGRWQIIGKNPKIVVDTGHNKQAIQWIAEQLALEPYKNLHMVLGVVNDKDLKSILPIFPKLARYYFCKPEVPRGLNAKTLWNEAKKYDLNGHYFASVEEALNAAKSAASKTDLIFVGGSTFTVAEII